MIPLILLSNQMFEGFLKGQTLPGKIGKAESGKRKWGLGIGDWELRIIRSPLQGLNLFCQGSRGGGWWPYPGLLSVALSGLGISEDQ